MYCVCTVCVYNIYIYKYILYRILAGLLPVQFSVVPHVCKCCMDAFNHNRRRYIQYACSLCQTLSDPRYGGHRLSTSELNYPRFGLVCTTFESTFGHWKTQLFQLRIDTTWQRRWIMADPLWIEGSNGTVKLEHGAHESIPAKCKCTVHVKQST